MPKRKPKLTNHSVEKMINVIRKYFDKILDRECHNLFDEIKANTEASYESYIEGNQPTWGYVIHSKRPLIFTDSERPTIKNRVDVYCKVSWQDEFTPVEQDIKVRVWGLAENVIYRQQIDSENVLDMLSDPKRLHKGRVISRYHFDKTTNKDKKIEYHPIYHMQVGGKAEEYELCWHPDSFDIPRIPHQPMDLFLTCQLVAINFFPNRYKEFNKETAFTGVLFDIQEKLLRDYYEKSLNAIKEKKSLLDFFSES